MCSRCIFLEASFEMRETTCVRGITFSETPLYVMVENDDKVVARFASFKRRTERAAEESTGSRSHRILKERVY